MNPIYKPLWGALTASLFCTQGSAGVASNALPSGGQVVAGSASIGVQGNTLTVTQTSQRTAIDWKTFNIGSGATVKFVQPSSSSVVLNRVVGQEPSQIYGHLEANGQVFFINPNGILFARGSQVNVGGLLASTLNMTNYNFMAGNYVLKNPGKGSITNEGTLKTNGQGSILLIGPTVDNAGAVFATTITLAAGNTVAVNLDDDGLMRAHVDDAELAARIHNSGTLQGSVAVTLTAGQARKVLDSVVNNTGVIRANSLTSKGGTILLEAVDVSNTGTIEAQGATGGGDIRLMGNMAQGHVRAGGVLDASAAHSGDGGFIETSAAHVSVDDGVQVTTHAAQGTGGTWLIDPKDFVIAASGGDMSGTTLSKSLETTGVSIASSRGKSDGNGDIIVNDAVTWSANRLSLLAHRDVQVNAVMTANGSASLSLTTDSSNVGNGGTVRMGLGGNGFTGKVNFGSRSGTGFLFINGKNYKVINTLDGLQGVQSNLFGYWALGSDVNAEQSAALNGGAGFNPIGSGSASFLGAFDGLGHTVSKLVVNRPNSDNQGLFGQLTRQTFAGQIEGSVRNIGLVDAQIVGANNVGALVGKNLQGNITNSFATGSVTGAQNVGGLVGYAQQGSITNSYAAVRVRGHSDYVGGLVGFNFNANFTPSLYGSASISNSFATGSVTGDGSYVGGLVGLNYNANASITNSYASGSVAGAGDYVGGLVGANSSASITNSFATGHVSGSGNVGGLVGTGASGSVTDSFWDTETTGIGTNASRSASHYGTGKTTAEMKSRDTYAKWNIANTAGSNAVWRIYEGNTYPLLRNFMTALTVTANDASKTYDGQNYAGGNGVGYQGDASHVLGDPSYTGSSQGARNAGTYALGVQGLYSDQGGYDIGYVNGTLVVNKANLTVSTRDVTKTYDGNTSANGNPIAVLGTEVFNGDTLSGGSYAFTDKNAGPGKTVTVADVTVHDGNDGNNYNVTYRDNTTSTITQAALRVSNITANNKTYDGNTKATLDTSKVSYSGLVEGEHVTLQSATGLFADKNVGNGKAVTVSGVTVNDSNYTVTAVDGTRADITPAALKVSNITAQNKTYDGNTKATLDTSKATYSGVVEGERVTLQSATGLFADKNVGNGKAVTVSGVTVNDSNYIVTTVDGTRADITPAALKVSNITANNKIYDGNTKATLDTSKVRYSGLVAGDSVSLNASGAFDSKDVGVRKTVRITSQFGGADGNNYVVGAGSQSEALANIAPITAVRDVDNAAAMRELRQLMTAPRLGLEDPFVLLDPKAPAP